MTVHLAILLVLAIVEMLLALYIFFRYQRSPSIYALACMLVGFSAMAMLVAAQLVTDDAVVRIVYGKLAFYAGSVAFVSLFALAVYFPVPSAWLVRYAPLLFGVPLAFLFPYILFSPLFLADVQRNGSALHLFPEKGFVVFALFAIAYFVWTIVLLLQKLRFVAGEQRRQVLLLTVVTALSGTSAILATMVLPMFGIRPNSTIGGEVPGFVALLIASIVLKR